MSTAALRSRPAHDNQPEQKLNGKLTLGENTADNGGLRIAYMALLDTLAAEGKTIDDKIDGYTEAQRYFLGFAQVWCQNQTEQVDAAVGTDRSALAGRLAREWICAELRRVREGFRLHQGPADVSGEILPRLVSMQSPGAQGTVRRMPLRSIAQFLEHLKPARRFRAAPVTFRSFEASKGQLRPMRFRAVSQGASEALEGGSFLRGDRSAGSASGYGYRGLLESA